MMRHEVDTYVVGAGTGDTFYRGICDTCGWCCKSYRASDVLDWVGAHELGVVWP